MHTLRLAAATKVALTVKTSTCSQATMKTCPGFSLGRYHMMHVRQLLAVATIAGTLGLAAVSSGAAVASAAPHLPPVVSDQGHGGQAPQRSGPAPAVPPPPGPAQPPPAPQDGPGDHGGQPPSNPGGGWHGRFNGAPWGDGPAPWGWGAPPPPAWDGPLPRPDGPQPPPINYWGYWCQPVWDAGFNQWGFWFFGVWVPL